MLPVILAAAALATVLYARADDRAARAAPTGPAALANVTTPVLSARRAPLVVQAPYADAQLAAAVERRVLASSPADSCLVVRERGRTIYARNDQKALVPASNLKLLVAVAALDVLGAETRFATVATADAAPANGVIAGNLYVVGGGDPVLSTKDYVERYGYPFAYTDIGVLAERIVAAGVTTIRGDLVGDDRRYDRERYVPSWPSRLITQGQVGPIGALVVNDGFVTYGRDPEVTTQNVATDDPAGHAMVVLRRELQNRGVRITGLARAGDRPPVEKPVDIASLESPPMRDIVSQLLTVSDNNTAEALTKEMGLKARNEPTTSAGVAVVRSAVETRFRLDGVTFADGSGLDPVRDKLTCALVADILSAQPANSPILTGLPLAGRTGTLHDRFETPPLAGNLRGKTGRLQNSIALSGTVTSTTERALVYAFIANTPPDQRVPDSVINVAHAALADILVGYPAVAPLDALSPKPPRAGG